MGYYMTCIDIIDAEMKKGNVSSIPPIQALNADIKSFQTPGNGFWNLYP